MGVIFSKKIKNIIVKNRERKWERKMKKIHSIAKRHARKHKPNPYPLNMKPVQVRFIGHDRYDTPIILKFSHTYKGVPGGFYT